MKKLIILSMLILSSLAFNRVAHAQAGFLPEFLGNANGVGSPGLCIKFFPSYYYQKGIRAHDAEAAFEPQYWIPGFTRDLKKDQFQFVVHLPVGYRQQRVAAGTVESVTGIGNITTTVEYYYHFIDEEEMSFWFDNGLTGGWPTATEHNGIAIGGKPYSVAIGSRAYSVGWYQENFFRYKKFMMSIQPITFTYGFKDSKTNTKSGLSFNIMNGSAGYQVHENIFLGVNFAFTLGNVLGSTDGAGNALPKTRRLFAGPAALFAFNENNSIQVGVLIDAYTKNVSRGQGIAIAIWHHF